MSSLSRRACYKCGNVGHYAGQCMCMLKAECRPSNSAQKYALHKNVCATTVSHLTKVVSLGTSANNENRQTARYIHSALLATPSKDKWSQSNGRIGHESNGCPHPRTTDSKSMRTLKLDRTPEADISISKAVLPLPRPWPRPGRLPHSSHKWRRYWRRTLLFMWPAGPSCRMYNRGHEKPGSG